MQKKRTIGHDLAHSFGQWPLQKTHFTLLIINHESATDNYFNVIISTLWRQLEARLGLTPIMAS